VSEPFLAEIRIMSFNFAPRGWAMCNGQHLPINQNQALFSLLGTTYGGNGQVDFALPDMRGRVPMHFDFSWTLGSSMGEYNHTVTQSEMPTHAHFVKASANPATTSTPDNTVGLAASSGSFAYAPSNNLVAMAPNMVSNTGGSQAHSNRMPYLTLTFCIALIGFFPDRD
jgi:microcystin-dependent protein